MLPLCHYLAYWESKGQNKVTRSSILKNTPFHIARFTWVICWLAVIGSALTLQAQDSTRRPNANTPVTINKPAVTPLQVPTPPPTAPKPQTPVTTNGQSYTVPPIEVPLNTPVKRKPRRLTAADSARIAAQRDSLARIQAMAAAPNAATPTAADSLNKINEVKKITPTTIPEVPTLSQSDNPFDMLRGANVAKKDSSIAKNTNTQKPNLLSREVWSKNFLFWIIVILLVLLVLVLQISRGVLSSVYQSLFSYNMLRMTYREQLGWGNVQYLSLYVLFWLNAGLFVFLLQYQLGVHSSYGQLTTFLGCVGGVSLVFMTKHLILYVIAQVFPITKEVKMYNFIVIISGILIGLLLAPINIFIAFASQLSNTLIYVALGMVAAIYLVRTFRSLAISANLWTVHRFHFFIYLCAVEIAPLLILVKFVLLRTNLHLG